MVFVIGGNGSHAGANAISAECASRGLKVSVVGIPKTIDNDILHIDKTFGFDTAVEEAQKAIKAAAVEAKSALNGVGVVKLMGRQSGFIAMHAALASGSVDVCLIPEVPFAMEGPNGVVEHVKNLLATQGHAVICLAEGAGQEYVQGAGGRGELASVVAEASSSIEASVALDVDRDGVVSEDDMERWMGRGW